MVLRTAPPEDVVQAEPVAAPRVRMAMAATPAAPVSVLAAAVVVAAAVQPAAARPAIRSAAPEATVQMPAALSPGRAASEVRRTPCPQLLDRHHRAAQAAAVAAVATLQAVPAATALNSIRLPHSAQAAEADPAKATRSAEVPVACMAAALVGARSAPRPNRAAKA
jgi:hypothetical protein